MTDPPDVPPRGRPPRPAAAGGTGATGGREPAFDDDAAADGGEGAAGEPDAYSDDGAAARAAGVTGAPAGERRASPAKLDPPVAARLPLEVLRLAGTGSGPHRGRRARAAGLGAGAIDSRPAEDGAGAGGGVGDPTEDLAVVATLRARLTGTGGLRRHVRAGREGVLLCLVVDASGSMGARRRVARVKGALLGLLADAYAARDRVAVIAFRDGGASVLVAPGTPVERAAAAVRALPTGGRTPLAEGLDAASALLRRERLREPDRRAIAVVLTDGRVADPAGLARAAAARLGRAATAVHVVDTEDGPVRLGLAGALAAAAGGRVHPLCGAV